MNDMKSIQSFCRSLLPHQVFDSLAVGVVDFKTKKFECFEMTSEDGEVKLEVDPILYFDLASLTKPLTNSLSYFISPKDFTNEAQLCLNHRGGLPSWGLLPNDKWREIIESYSIKESETLYSDYSALRAMLEFEKKSGKKMKDICSQVWDQEMMNWKDLPDFAPVPQMGERSGVHDPNAFTIGDFCSHAGLFSTINGVCQTLLNYQEKTDFISKVTKDLSSHNHRFSYGWDRVTNPDETLAGKGCHLGTFGHLGFTGTSIWIDPVLMRASVILSNGTQKYWYEKSGLNEIRRGIGQLVWSI